MTLEIVTFLLTLPLIPKADFPKKYKQDFKPVALCKYTFYAHLSFTIFTRSKIIEINLVNDYVYKITICKS